jgi:hypothetical protein
MPNAANILKVLRDELALQSRHCKLLEAQEAALMSCDRAQFFHLQSEHTRLLPLLEAQQEARQAILRDDEGQPCTLSVLIESCPDASRRALTGAGESLRVILGRIQLLSARNQQLVENELKYLAFTLELFVEAGRSADRGYGGRMPGSRLLLDRRA